MPHQHVGAITGRPGKGECVTAPCKAPLYPGVLQLTTSSRLRRHGRDDGITVGTCRTIPSDLFLAYHRAGEFPFERLLAFWPLAETNQAVADMEAGRVIKPVLTMP